MNGMKILAMTTALATTALSVCGSELDLAGEWRLQEITRDGASAPTYACTVPGDAYCALLKAGVITEEEYKKAIGKEGR